MLPHARPGGLPALPARLGPLAALIAGVVSPSAFAAFPQDVSLVAMDDYDGVSTVALSSDDYVAEGYRIMAKELGTAIANKPMAPGETLGVNGFQVGLANTFAFIRTGTLDGTNVTGWDLAMTDNDPDTDDDPQPYLFIPQLQLRKGLPLSLEVGANFGWIGLSNTGVFGGYGRWAVMEGYRKLPDLTFQLGYAGYVGNDELELGVMDASATVGYSLPFGVTQGIHQAVFSPYVAFGINSIHAAPRADLSRTGLDDPLDPGDPDGPARIDEVSGASSADPAVYDKSFAPFTLGGGFRIVNGDFAFTLAGSYSPSLIATVNFSFGFVY